MNSSQRVLTALRCGVPDRVPFAVSVIDTELQEAIVGHDLQEFVFDQTIDPGFVAKPGDDTSLQINYCVHPDTADKIGLDAIGVKFNYPLYVSGRLERGGFSVEGGLVKTREDLAGVRMPDPDQEDVLEQARAFVSRFKGRYALYVCVRLGISPVLMSMGYDTFSLALYDDRELINGLLSKYLEFNTRFLSNLADVGFEYIWAFDDIAFGTGPLFSPAVWDEVFAGPVGNMTRGIKVPWIYHSDGNLLPILDRMLELGMSGIHPLEPGTMDLGYLKKTYGDRVCLVGNIDIGTTLSSSPVEAVYQEVKDRIDVLGTGGGYIVSDSNSVPYFCKAPNIIAMGDAVRRYGRIY